MMGLSAPMLPSVEEVAAMAQKMALPGAVKAKLADIGQQLDALNKKREEVATLQKQADVDRAAIDKRAAESNENITRQSAALAGREAALQARAAAFSKVVAEFEGKLAAHAATLESST